MKGLSVVVAKHGSRGRTVGGGAARRMRGSAAKGEVVFDSPEPVLVEIRECVNVS